MTAIRRLYPLLVALLLVSLHSHATAQSGPSISVEPAAQTVPATGGAFEARIMVDDVTAPEGLGGYALAVTYDPAVVHALSITDSGLVSSTGNSPLCLPSVIDNEAGEASHVCFIIPIFSQPGPQFSDPQALATIAFEPAGAGTTTLDVSETSIVDGQGNDLAAVTSSGTVTVQGAGPQPTAGDGTPTTDQETSGDQETPSPPNDTGAEGSALPALGSSAGNESTRFAYYVALGLLAFGCAALMGSLLLARRDRHLDAQRVDNRGRIR